MKNIFIILMLLSSFVSAVFHAQEKFILDSKLTEKGSSKGSYYLGTDRNGYIYIETYKNIFVGIGVISVPYIKVVNPYTSQILHEGKRQPTELKRNGYKSIGFEFFNETPYIICRKKEDLTGSDYYLQEISPHGELRGRPFLIGTKGTCKGFNSGSSKPFSRGVYYFYDSKKREKYFISDLNCMGKDGEAEFKLVHLNNTNNELFQKNFIIPVDPNYDELEFAVKNEKAYLSIKVITKERQKGKLIKTSTMKNHLFVLNYDGTVEEIFLNLGENYAASSISVYENNDNIGLSGKTVINGSNNFVGLFSGIMDKETNEIKDLTINELDDKIKNRFFSKKQIDEAQRNGSQLKLTDNFKAMDNIKTEDGGNIQILQKYRFYSRTSYTTDSKGHTTTDLEFIYEYRDLIIYKTDIKGEIIWVSTMPFLKRYVDYDPGISYKLMQTGGKILFIHDNFTQYDEINTDYSNTSVLSLTSSMEVKNKKMIFVTVLNQEGKFTHYPVINLSKDFIFFEPTKVAVNEDEGLFFITTSPNKAFKSKKRLLIKTIELAN